MTKYLATFYIHFGALKFNKDCKAISIKSRKMPAPRSLSASCGTCVVFETDDISTVLKSLDLEHMEGCYLVVGKGKYNKIEF